MDIVKKERVIAYIDGYNLYFGLIEGGYKRYLWLDIQALIFNLLKPNQELIQVNFFTTLVTNNVDKRMRQKTYISALQTLKLVKVFYGKFQKEENRCKNCGSTYTSESEKMTDVNIATNIVSDYYENKFDMAMIISGDTDLLPPIKLINENSKDKRVFVAFPPSRVNDEVRRFSKGDLVIGRKNLLNSQLPETVFGLSGEKFIKPESWV